MTKDLKDGNIKTIGMSNFEIQKDLHLSWDYYFYNWNNNRFCHGPFRYLLLSTDYMEVLLSLLMRDSYFINYFPTDVRWNWVSAIMISTLIADHIRFVFIQQD